MRVAERVVGALSAAMAALSAGGVLVLMLVTTADVVRRTLLGQPIPGVFEFSEILVVAVVFLGMAQAQRMGSHVGVTMVVDRLPATLAKSARVLALSVSLLIIGLLAWVALPALVDSIQSGEHRFGLARVPLWPARLAVLAGFAGLFLETLRSLLLVIASSDAPVGGAGGEAQLLGLDDAHSADGSRTGVASPGEQPSEAGGRAGGARSAAGRDEEI